MMKELFKKRLILGISMFLFLFFIGIMIWFLIPINNFYKDVNGYNVKITLRRKINGCLIKYKYKNKKDVFFNSLLKTNGYNKKYEKEEYYKSNCGSLLKMQKKNKVNFKLIGSKKMIINVKESYKDLGVKAKVNNEKAKVITSSNLNADKIGTYHIFYKLDNNLVKKYYLYRIVLVVDKQNPVITLNGDSIETIYKDSVYEEKGASATDNYDGDLTNKIVKSGNVDTTNTGSYEITYTVTDKSGNTSSIKRVIKVIPKSSVITGVTYIKGILIVNKKYALPSDYNPGTDSEAMAALNRMQADASSLGLDLKLISGFRSYGLQSSVYNSYVSDYGEDVASTFSAKPGHSEHQTGLAFDIGDISNNFGNTDAGRWAYENCQLYGFILRYPKGKESITGYKYEPWHFRYLGVDNATKVKNSGLTLEEYLGVN